MIYYSTNGKAPRADLRKAVVKGLAEDKGLYMPERIPRLSAAFFKDVAKHSFVENATQVAKAFFGEDVPDEVLEQIVAETLTFDCPVKEVEPGIWSLELFHGPTLAFKDVGARFMARLLRYFTKGQGELNVLVATSGDTKIIKTSYVIDELTYEEATELCNFGAKVVYPPTLYPVCLKGMYLQNLWETLL